MTDAQGEQSGVDAIPEAVVTSRQRFSLVWLIPLVAVLVGAWLVYSDYVQQGPTVSISFRNANGVEAGKTKVRFKEVEVGLVEEIHLDPDLERVVVTARMAKEMEDFLSSETRFWVERARVTASQISGLRTLFSGAYIAMDPVRGDPSQRFFKGLDAPPVVTTREVGSRFKLRAQGLGSLNLGSPIYHRQIRAGQVAGFQLSADGSWVDIDIFVPAPFDGLVTTNTRFWNTSGFNVNLTSDGVKLNSESLMSVLIGGIAFGDPPNAEPGRPVASDHVFELFPSRETADDAGFAERSFFLLYFDGSVRGLKAGAPVEIRGIRIGRVLDIKLELYPDGSWVKIPVLIEVETERINFIGELPEARQEKVASLRQLVKRGLRAQLKTGSLLTGQLFIDFDLHPEAPPADITEADGYLVLPTAPGSLEELSAGFTRIVDKLDRLPLEEIGADLRDAVKAAKELIDSNELRSAVLALNATLQETEKFAAQLNTETAPALSSALRQGEATLAATQRLVTPESQLYQDLKRTLRELSNAARSIRIMADYLERHPDALIYGKGGSGK